MGHTLSRKTFEPWILRLVCCQDRYSFTRARSCRSAGYQWSATEDECFCTRYIRIAMLQKNQGRNIHNLLLLTDQSRFKWCVQRGRTAIVPFCQDEVPVFHDRNFPHAADFPKLLAELLPWKKNPANSINKKQRHRLVETLQALCSFPAHFFYPHSEWVELWPPAVSLLLSNLGEVTNCSSRHRTNLKCDLMWWYKMIVQRQTFCVYGLLSTFKVQTLTCNSCTMGQASYIINKTAQGLKAAMISELN